MSVVSLNSCKNSGFFKTALRMNNFDSYNRKAFLKSESKTCKLCLPRVDPSENFYFSYFYIDEQGNYYIVSNTLNEIEYYFVNNIAPKHPYLCHSNFFQQGYKIIQQTLHIRTYSTINENIPFFNNFSLLDKFIKFFKIEARKLLRSILAQGYNFELEKFLSGYLNGLRLSASIGSLL